LRKIAFLFVIASSLCRAQEEEGAVRRIYSHLLVRDPSSAVKEARRFLDLYPDFRPLQMAYLKALCQKGEEVEAFQQFSSVEWLAWGVLNKCEDSQMLLVRLYSLLGAAFTHDARAIPILLKELQGSNALLRSLAVKLSAQYRDAPLRQELLRMLKEEKVWFVKLEVIQAVGALSMSEAKKTLQEIIAHPKTLAEEKGAAIIALAGMYETISLQELSQLVQSDRSGLRQLAAELVAHLEFQEGADLLLPLLSDDSPYVRISTMKALGFLEVRVLQGKGTIACIQDNLKDSHPEVSIMAGWLAMLLGNSQGKDVLKHWIEQSRIEPKRLASAALSVTGTSGADLALQKMESETDVYTKVNLALGLIGQRKEVKRSSDVLFQALEEGKKELWMWESGSNGFFRTLGPSKVRHREEMPQYPQMMDQLVKLELLSVLSIVKYPKALEAVKGFLKTQALGVSGTAATTLLQEGEESSLEIVKELLSDPDEKLRIQAALILALVGGDPSASSTLIDAYPHVDREMKMHILEALGHIGDPASIPFLVELFKEPFQGLRIVAASALIQCLYH
jgi:HEAT repeat protein